MKDQLQHWLETSEPRTVLLIVLGVLLLAIAAQVSSLIVPQYQRLSAAENSLDLLRGAGSGGSGLQVRLNEMTDQVASLSQVLHGDMADLPPEQMEAYVVGRMQRVSWDSGVDLISVRPADGEQVQQFRETLFNVEIHARYADFFRWMQRMDREVGFVVVEKYRIRPIGDDHVDPMLNVTVTMAAYRMVRS